MKQIIKLEIQNDTGVEFEEQVEYRPPQQGEYFIADYSNKIECAVDYFERKHYIVLTPKVDHELEEAKKKYIGRWVQCNNNSICKITDAYRGREESAGEIVFMSGYESIVGDLTIVPLPTWRCCESDKPKKSGKYFVRLKTPPDHDNNHRDTALFGGSVWYMADSEDREWLDEGEK